MAGPDILGRDDELAVTARFLAGVAEGPAAILLEGEAGIGKTTIHEALLDEARNLGFRVLAARAAQAQRAMPFVVLTDLFESSFDDVERHLPQPQAHALRVALLRVDDVGTPGSPRALLQAVSSAVVLLAKQSPLLIAVDDVQWTDRASADALAYAARRLSGPIGIAIARRHEPGDPTRAPPFELHRTIEPMRFQRVVVRGLPVAVIFRLIRDRLGISLPRPSLLRIHEISAGNPLFALEIAARIDRETGPDVAGMVMRESPTLRGLVEERTERLPHPTRGALLFAAATSRPTVETLSAAMGEDVRDALAEAERAGVVAINRGRIRFTHPLLAAVAYSSAPAERRRKAHQRLAEVVDDVDERTRHLALAADAPSPVVAELLDAAARRARSKGARGAAAEFAEEARRLTPPQHKEDLRRRSIEAADHHFHAGDLRRARTLLDEVLNETTKDVLRASALLLAAEIAYHENSFVEALKLLEEALEHAQGDAKLIAFVSMRLAFVLTSLGDFAGAPGPAETAVQTAESCDEPALIAEALAVRAMVQYLSGQGLDRAAVDRSLALEDPNRWVVPLMRPSLIAGFLDVYDGNLDAAEARLSALRVRLLERGEDEDLPYVSSYLAWTECWRGNLDSAERYGREAVEVAGQLGTEALYGYTLAMGVALVAAHRGDESGTRTAADDAVAIFERTGWVVGFLWARWSEAILELSLGHATAAEQALAPLTGLVEAMGVDEPVRAMFLPEAIEALIGIGERERAARLIEVWEACAQRLDRAWALAAGGRCRALLHAAAGDLDAALAALGEALGQQARTPMPIAQGRTLLLKGQIERRAGHRRSARETLEHALDVFQRHGHRLWAERARDELRRVQPRRKAPADLTPTEAQVAKAAAKGKTTREIAEALFISPKTVEANLAKVYRKLGIHSRAELGAAMADRADRSSDT